ncbi:carboxylesterase/lipase family protein [Chloroflexota bacterium]
MDMAPVKIDTGYISGTVIGEPGKEVRVYKGIPYAAPPAGDLRWKPPQPAAPWNGTRECTEYSIQAAQYPDVNVPEEAQKIPSSEDCLYLNINTPANNFSEKLPVMVWLHGGGLRYGSGNWTLYNAPGLPQHGVVLVTVNSRLGEMGLVAHPLLTKESPDNASGNYMFLDMIAALKWVQRNIAAFGGNPDNVTIFGESGGGDKVVCMLTSPLSKGLFHRAICESGGSRSHATPLEDMEEHGKKLFARLGVDKESDPLAAVRAIDFEKIIEVSQAMNEEVGGQFAFMGPWGITNDGWFMPDSPYNIIKEGKHNAVPMITCANLGELTGPGYVHVPEMIPGYVKLLSGANEAGKKGYAAIFDQVPGNFRKEGGVAAHAMEMHYVFGAVDDPMPWDILHFLYQTAGAKSPSPVITDAERNVSEAMMKMWANFARTGDPSVKGLIEWPAWEKTTDKYLYIVEPLQVKSGFSKVAQE